MRTGGLPRAKVRTIRQLFLKPPRGGGSQKSGIVWARAGVALRSQDNEIEK
jgi:hypothetical protein